MWTRSSSSVSFGFGPRFATGRASIRLRALELQLQRVAAVAFPQRRLHARHRPLVPVLDPVALQAELSRQGLHGLPTHHAKDHLPLARDRPSLTRLQRPGRIIRDRTAGGNSRRATPSVAPGPTSTALPRSCLSCCPISLDLLHAVLYPSAVSKEIGCRSRATAPLRRAATRATTATRGTAPSAAPTRTATGAVRRAARPQRQVLLRGPAGPIARCPRPPHLLLTPVEAREGAPRTTARPRRAPAPSGEPAPPWPPTLLARPQRLSRPRQVSKETVERRTDRRWCRRG